eukprot:CAMPEP_0115020364 /NCGR_PEP_ID=MMETSP0216-20121206/30065_1 /TAXON_ID=223996 /ORGANISM="Protocruzia adherens, Strain Boccale" /LENGTH=166 /DNA_ID=CAMNT_0002392151 /DNA_START=1 /DNA_END=501 /DNA_ORIENTATION=-
MAAALTVTSRDHHLRHGDLHKQETGAPLHKYYYSNNCTGQQQEKVVAVLKQMEEFHRQGKLPINFNPVTDKLSSLRWGELGRAWVEIAKVVFASEGLNLVLFDQYILGKPMPDNWTSELGSNGMDKFKGAISSFANSIEPPAKMLMTCHDGSAIPDWDPDYADWYV